MDIERMRHQHYLDDTWKGRPGHELYRWLAQAAIGNQSRIQHIKAHTDGTDERSQLNDKADHQARRAHRSTHTVTLPPLTGWMREYSTYIHGVGFAQDNWADNYQDAMTEIIFARQTTNLQARLSDPLCPSPPIPDYFYHKSPAGATAKFQLILRSGTFQTNELDHRMTAQISPSCDLCGAERQSEYHLFVQCPYFSEYRTEAIDKATRLHVGMMAKEEKDHAERALAFKTFSQFLVFGTRAYPTQYWRGITPPVPPPLTHLEYTMSHHLAIVLTSRIAGAYLRERGKRVGPQWEEKKRKGKT